MCFQILARISNSSCVERALTDEHDQENKANTYPYLSLDHNWGAAEQCGPAETEA